MSEFDRDTGVQAVGSGEYTAELSDRWHALSSTPNGGYLVATCLQALRREVPLPDPLVVSAFFLRPGVVGPATLHTELVRAGRRTATGQVSMRQDGKETLRVTATFTDLDRTEGMTELVDGPPALPPPQECVDARTTGAMPAVTIGERVEYRFGQAPGWLTGTPRREPSTQFWTRLRDGREPDLLVVPLLVDAAPPAVLELGASSSTTLQLTVHLRARPVPGWLACRVSTRFVTDGVHEEDFEVWDSRGRLVAQSRQLALLQQDGARAGDGR